MAAACVGLPVQAHAEIVRVGQNGPACDEPTIEDALLRVESQPGHHEIRITRDVAGGVWRENVRVPRLDVELVGGFDTCDDDEPSGRSRITGTGGVEHPVLSFSRGGNVRLAGLSIEEGVSGESDHAAGIEFYATGELTLSDVAITASRAVPASAWRAALGVRGDREGVVVRLLEDVSITDNLSGGVDLLGSVTLIGSAPRIEIARNAEAGVIVREGAAIDLGTSGDAIAGNGHWGLMFLPGSSSTFGSRVSRLYSIDPEMPLRVADNDRGAILMLGGSQPLPSQRLCTRNVSIVDHEVANPTGGFIGVVEVDGANVRLDMDAACPGSSDAAFDCAADRCRRFAGNRKLTGGPLIGLHHGGQVSIERTAFLDNDAGSLVSAGIGTWSPGTHLAVRDSLVARNALDDHVIGAFNGASVEVGATTIAGNLRAFRASFLAAEASAFTVEGSIVDQSQPLLAIDGGQPMIDLRWLLARNTIGASGADGVEIGIPIYEEKGSYRQRADSPGIDRAPSRAGFDADGLVRAVDLQHVPDGGGARDLGAYERQDGVPDLLFVDGFGGTD